MSDDKIRIIEAQHYRDEVETLKKDPVIISMAATIPKLDKVEYVSWNFIQAASHEYHYRGGTEALSIGGPAKAVAALHAQGFARPT